MVAKKPESVTESPQVTDTKRYSVISGAGFHHPDGFVPLGGTIELTDEQAERGLAAALICLTPVPAQAADRKEN
jgi:hypothetical protein